MLWSYHAGKFRKNIYVVIGLLFIILLSSIIICTRNSGNNKKTKIILNEDEEELLSIINQIELDNATFKEVCTKLYEIRETNDTNGNTVYIFDMEANTVAIAESGAMDLLEKHTKGLSEEHTERRKYYLKENQFILCTFSGQDFNNQSADVLIAFSIANSSIEGMWEKGKIYKDVDYEKILKSL